MDRVDGDQDAVSGPRELVVQRFGSAAAVPLAGTDVDRELTAGDPLRVGNGLLDIATLVGGEELTR
jgi:hypothetical protein